jgi:hypothetical protein
LVTATESPAFTPWGIDPGALPRSRFHQPLHGLAVGDHEHLGDAGERGHRLAGHEHRGRILAHEDVATREEAGPQHALGVGHSRLDGECARADVDGRRHACDGAGEHAGAERLHAQPHRLARPEVGRLALRHRAHVLEWVGHDDREQRRVVLHALPGRHVALGDESSQRGLHRRVAQPLLRETECGLALLDLRLGRPHGGEIGVVLGVGRAHLIGILGGQRARRRGLSGGDVQLVARVVDVAGGDQLALVQLLRALHLPAHELELRLRARDVRFQHRPRVLRALERRLAGHRGGAGARQRLLRDAEIGLGLIDGQLELAPVVVGQHGAHGHAVAKVDVQAGDGAGLLGLGLDLVGGQHAAARLHRALDGARLGGRHVHRDGPDGSVGSWGRRFPGHGLGLGLAAIAGERAQEGDQQACRDKPGHTEGSRGTQPSASRGSC